MCFHSVKKHPDEEDGLIRIRKNWIINENNVVFAEALNILIKH